MEFIKTLLIALALAMDSFSVSITGGASMKVIKIRNALLVAIYFGFFQSFMTTLGWLGGSFLNKYICHIDHWLAFILLLIIGSKMIYDSYQNDPEKCFYPNHKILCLLAIATSIDAFGIGLSYSFLNKNITIPVIIIGFVAFSFSGIGLYLGKYLKKMLKNKANIFGGIVLIIIGIKILLEHTIL